MASHQDPLIVDSGSKLQSHETNYRPPRLSNENAASSGSNGIWEETGPERLRSRPNGDASLNANGYQLSDIYANQEISDDVRSNDNRSEKTHLQRRDLGVFDVAALIINKQIGTGIFTTPGLVLSLTGSKTTSIIMWFCGGIWALLSVIIYVEFGSAFPFNGGELIYVNPLFPTIWLSDLTNE